ncbi:uncharacterized protein LOC118407163 [Branchiostoma floridae]|uniref:Uncharacterized protein LOC118407163 n=1 Tax=Branchiostoma floridae TaxID=7739 RepID=A0A9J7KKI6_BRAFL|nr:uncharacterized protein LOC118407163 [Branchiostoma floridae]
MACSANKTQYQASDSSTSPTQSQTEVESIGAVGMEQKPPEWLILACLGNRILAAPLLSELQGDDWKGRYSVQDKQGKSILLYKADIFRLDEQQPGRHFITGDDIDKSTRRRVNEVLQSMFQQKNSNVHVDTGFEYCKQ